MMTISSSLKVILVCLRCVPFTDSLVVVILTERWSVLLRYSIFPSGEKIFHQKYKYFQQNISNTKTFIMSQLDDSQLCAVISEEFDGKSGCAVRQQFGLDFPRD